MPSLAVDPVACDAFGYCAELLPELVSLDEWGYPVVGDDPVPAALVTRAAEAARRCPRRALLLRIRDAADPPPRRPGRPGGGVPSGRSTV